jgi:hypothetical protein
VKFYCPVPGMEKGNDAAYKCGDGYLCAAGSESIRGDTQCPIDHFCKDGDSTKCDAGTIGVVGNSLKTECTDCPPGKICPNNSVGIIDCPAGKFCPGKHFNNASISDCTPGHYCPTGSKEQLKCKPGTYQNVKD